MLHVRQLVVHGEERFLHHLDGVAVLLLELEPTVPLVHCVGHVLAVVRPASAGGVSSGVRALRGVVEQRGI